LLVEQLVE
jgi:carbon monoxide dehydrogenase subunit G